MNITIIAVGKLKEKYLQQAVAEYSKRISSYAKLTIMEIPDEKAPEHLSKTEEESVKRAEGERILAKVPADAYVIALAIEGKNPSSEQFAANLEKLATYGNSKLVFIIGGSLGLSDNVLKRANELLSFSKMTFPHQLMRVVLLEQVYRAFRIMRGEPYHK
ncbi:23S rRNA (pseudouridine(1915)-N(3))-methyltransferase RlmH [Pueribacillus theae]|uniref:Ribosomal RNA large subunit methyltransferase H n=1 Tax=Pueribacillus theae TaxID=2171751 RepID=A0A2U1JP07_9BACI|nr:23S rRNA (pseudouridine(1915)-N(3))-methyltransferase RlmH [Pueribacillus theae]PWA06623.1 23S rRNA (pseudouridine(1915)-N(3))-methyltransferase RlmH [Pueribacillus theae]